MQPSVTITTASGTGAAPGAIDELTVVDTGDTGGCFHDRIPRVNCQAYARYRDERNHSGGYCAIIAKV